MSYPKEKHLLGATMSFAQLRELMNSHFNKSELQLICFDLEIDHENLPSNTKNDLVRELIEHCFRFKLMEKLIKHCKELRPTVSWPEPQFLSSRPKTTDYLTSNLAIAFKARDYPECVKIFELIKQKESPTAEAYCYLALALVSGRNFNSLDPREREQIEIYLNLARNKDAKWMLPIALLAILEIDYYEIHGMVSDNDIDIYDVAEELKNGSLSIEDCEYLKSIKISQDATQQLDLDMHCS